MKDNNEISVTEHFYKVNDEIYEIIKKYLPNSLKQIKNTNFPLTLRALLHFHTNSNFIKNGIIDLINSDNLYGAKILYRSLIEHFLKSEYLFMKVIKNKNDTVGWEYFNLCNFDENKKYAKSYKQSAKLYGIDLKENFDFDTFRKQFSEVKNLTNKEIDEKISQFNYRKIVSFIVKTLYNNKYDGNPFLLKIMPIFSELSSFVHAGPLSNSEMLKSSNLKIRNDTYKNMLEMTLLLSMNIISHFFIILSISYPEYQEAIKKIDSIMKNITGNLGTPY